MRDGSANCFVRLKDGPISSPVVDCPDVLIAMNQPALERFAPKTAPGGLILYDSDAVSVPDRLRISARCIGIPATSQASSAGVPKAANLVLFWELWQNINVYAECEAIFDLLPEPFKVRDLMREY